MIRQIIVPTEPLVTLHLPEAMIGKTVELIAFEIEAMSTGMAAEDKTDRLKEIELLTARSLVDLSGFRFSRDEANNYNE